MKTPILLPLGLFLTLAVAGCAPNSAWQNSNSDADFNRDWGECHGKTRGQTDLQTSEGQATVAEIEFCMEARGWKNYGWGRLWPF
jgi:hypothetical protein